MSYLDMAKPFIKRLSKPAFLQGLLVRLKSRGLKPFEAGNTRFYNWNISFPDIISLLDMYTDIFVDETYLFKWDNPNPRILDVGANIGLSVLYFKKLYPGAIITALEADPQIMEYLRRNVHGNGYSDVDLIHKAAWYEETSLLFKTSGSYSGRVTTDLEENVIEVKAIDLSTLLEEQTYDFLKMDIEGAEEFVLPKCRGKLGRLSYIFIEYHSKVGQKQCLSEIINLFSDEGFRVYVQTEYCIPYPLLSCHSNRSFDMQLKIFARKL